MRGFKYNVMFLFSYSYHLGHVELQHVPHTFQTVGAFNLNQLSVYTMYIKNPAYIIALLILLI